MVAIIFTAIRSYFTDEQVLRSIGGIVGMEYEDIICGEYKVVVEPIAYYLFQGDWYATTAHEGALYNELVGGSLRTDIIVGDEFSSLFKF